MASITVQSIVDEINTRFQDLNVSPYTYQMLRINETHRWVCSNVPSLVGETATVVSLTSGTATYAFSGDNQRIRQAVWYDSPTSYRPLVPIDIDTLDNQFLVWRQTVPGTSTHYYKDGSNIGFWPPPNATTAGGYPNITVYGVQAPALILGGNLPDNVKQYWAYVFWACECWAEANSDTRAAYFKARRKSETGELIVSLNGVVMRKKGGVELQMRPIRTI